jgi:hypothetical protein
MVTLLRAVPPQPNLEGDNVKKAMKLFVAVAAVSMVGAVAYAGGMKKGMIMAHGELKWEPMAPGVPLQIATLWGDRAKGESGVLLKMPGGFESGMHGHTGDYHAVLVSGTWIHTEEGQTEAAKELPPGSYVMQPGKKMHNDACKAGADCIIFVHQKVKADFIPGKAPQAKETK